MNENPEQIERNVAALKSLMEKHKKHVRKMLHYARKTVETQKELEKFLKREALGEI